MLKTQVENITTNWKNVILNFEGWDKLEQQYESECFNFKGLLQIYPPIQNIFHCFHFFDIENTRVVLLGQDPYHGPNQANGLCFSVNDSCPTPPSLLNIKRELKNDREKAERLNLI